MVQLHEIEMVRDFISEKAKLLGAHEKKNFIKVGLDYSKFHFTVAEGKRFCIVATNTFWHLIDKVLAEATQKFPESFGKYDCYSVLIALYNIERPMWITQEHFEGFLRDEQFAWVIQIENDKAKDDVLRLDLFREIKVIKKAKNGETEFIGGIFHAFKHFCFNRVPLSTHPDSNEIPYPGFILHQIIKAYFLMSKVYCENGDIEVCIPLSTTRKLKFAFYPEIVSDVKFIRMIRKMANKS